MLAALEIVRGAPNDVSTRSLVPEKVIGAGDIVRLDYSPDDRFVAVLRTTGFQVQDVRTGRLLNSVSHLTPRAFALSWSPDGKRLAVGGDGLEIWDPLGTVAQRSWPEIGRRRGSTTLFGHPMAGKSRPAPGST